MARKTIRDIAREAGVSPTAVSFALNGRPGISPATRERILAIAERSDWAPNSRAQSLSRSKSDAVGLFIARKPDSYNTERFFFNFIVGLQNALTGQDLDLVFHTGPHADAEIATYRTWCAQGRVDGVVVVDPRVDDPRIAALRELQMPAVVVGKSVEGFASVVADERSIITTLAGHLYERGARTIGYVTGIANLVHTQERIEALKEFAADHAITALLASGEDATEESGHAAIRQLLNSDTTPDGIIFDNEILALGGFNALRAAGKEIGRDVLICSCEDSPLCRIVTPAITVVNREPAELGRVSAELLIRALGGESAPSLELEPAPLLSRESTAGLR
ncbi:LacI family DNA-binding transcriptional regulator [Trueperella pecoris]|uniref:LacI family DNA-binding transcriptional regulator n=1 Tax=Trueperella pecoris TaxID=2733571 RepID=A0A7M1QUA3_9ACTO|nr:LacI family DNA-binding transcriptional regulator [Trueperella pecoris]QOR45436.1 LacI family DNA-binding transcriptional regulator [Trueperella pecoris]